MGLSQIKLSVGSSRVLSLGRVKSQVPIRFSRITVLGLSPWLRSGVGFEFWS
uniref:Uncharacterized protein n=1 Tax=Cannabis sativa TaxID=3483 RepID=A0A803QRX2_CANSA